MEQLEQISGVRPSSEWLEACRQHLRAQHDSNGGGDTPDAILHQILHADLRDVVRVLPPFPEIESENQLQEQQQQLPSRVLRRAIVATAPSNATATATAAMPNTTSTNSNPSMMILPESFRLLCQIEELLDVSLNAEARLSVGPASPNNPTPIGNQRNRCLKLCISDGYCSDGSDLYDANNKNNDDVHPLVAMETTPIPNLSVHSKAGIKILVRGPLTIRFGVLLLNEGNATVLGGCVPSLLEIQKQALAQAQKVAGVGIDPTVRALIWNPHTGNEEENDEGEHESRDLPVSVAADANTLTGPPAPDPLTLTATRAIVLDDPSATLAATTNTIAIVPPVPVRQHQPPAPLPLINSNNNRSGQHALPQPFALLPARPAPTVVLGAAAMTTTPKNPYHRNPYASSSKSSSTQVAASTTATMQSTTTPTTLTENTTSQHTSRSNWKPPIIQTAGVEAAQKTKNSNTTDMAVVDLISPTHNHVGTPPTITTATIHASSSSQETGMPDDKINSGGGQQQQQQHHHPSAWSFTDLKVLLTQARDDRTLYKKYASHTFIVQSKQIGVHRSFNIRKKRKEKRKHKNDTVAEKYEYVMDCNFGGPQSGDGTITCKISSPRILEPHFGIAPSEMRRLNKEDKAQSQALVDSGGRKVKGELTVMTSWHMSLWHSCADFFTKDTVPQLDGDEPFLIVLNRHDSL